MVEPFLKRRPIKGWVVRLGSSSKRRLPCLRHSLHGDRRPRRSNQGENASDRFDRKHIKKAVGVNHLGSARATRRRPRKARPCPSRPGKPSYGSSFATGRFARCWS